MQKISLLCVVFVFNCGFAQKTKSEVKIKEKFVAMQSQDLSVPPPPKTVYPAHYPEGNKVFIEKVKNNINRNAVGSLPSGLLTKIILKIGSDGRVLNISTYGTNELLSKEVKKAAEKATLTTIWIPGENSSGKEVLDIVTLPFKFSKN